MNLELTFIGVVTDEPALDPHQRHAPATDRKITDLSAAGMDPSGLEPAMRQRDQDLVEATSTSNRLVVSTSTGSTRNGPQVQTHPHSVRSHWDPPGSAVQESPIPAWPRVRPVDPQPPLTSRSHARSQFRWLSRSSRLTSWCQAPGSRKTSPQPGTHKTVRQPNAIQPWICRRSSSSRGRYGSFHGY